MSHPPSSTNWRVDKEANQEDCNQITVLPYVSHRGCWASRFVRSFPSSTIAERPKIPSPMSSVHSTARSLPFADAAVALSALSVRSAHPVCHSLDEARSEKPILLRGIFLRVWDRFRARRSLTRLVSHLQNSFSSLLGNSHHMS